MSLDESIEVINACILKAENDKEKTALQNAVLIIKKWLAFKDLILDTIKLDFTSLRKEA